MFVEIHSMKMLERLRAVLRQAYDGDPHIR